MQEDHHFCRWHLPEGFSAEAALAAAFPGASRAQAAHQLDTCSPKELRVGAAAAPLAAAAGGWPLVVVGVGAEAASAAHSARMTHRLPSPSYLLPQEVFSTIFGATTTSNNTSW